MLVVGTIVIASAGIVAGCLLYARGAHVRLNRLLTERDGFATTGVTFSENDSGGRPGGKGGTMGVIVDDLRAGANDLVHETRTIVAYLTGAGLIASGILFRDLLPFRGFTLTVGGIVFMALAVFVPYVVGKLAQRPQPDITDELADVEAAVHAYVASQVGELKDLVTDVRAQLR